MKSNKTIACMIGAAALSSVSLVALAMIASKALRETQAGHVPYLTLLSLVSIGWFLGRSVQFTAAIPAAAEMSGKMRAAIFDLLAPGRWVAGLAVAFGLSALSMILLADDVVCLRIAGIAAGGILAAWIIGLDGRLRVSWRAALIAFGAYCLLSLAIILTFGFDDFAGSLGETFMGLIAAGPFYGLMLFLLLMAISLHEWGHGRAALFLGDTTALDRGRLTLDPSAHFSLIGMIVVPAALIFAGSPAVFGWAKPVPVNFDKLPRKRRDTIIVAAAGPIMSFVAAAVSIASMKLFNSQPQSVWWFAGWYFASVNFTLGAINLLPIPPLDGGRILLGLLPISRARYDRLSTPKYELRWALAAIGALVIGPVMFHSLTGGEFSLITMISNWVHSAIRAFSGHSNDEIAAWLEHGSKAWMAYVETLIRRIQDRPS